MGTDSHGNYSITKGSEDEWQVCFSQELNIGETPWQTQNPMIRDIPVLATELCFVIFAIRLFLIVLKPLHQPRFVAEVLASILIGPSAFREIQFWELDKSVKWLLETFPFESSMLVETFATIGLTYYMFLVGLEMDLAAMKHMGKRSLSIAFAGTLIPFGIGAGLHFIPIHKFFPRPSPDFGAVFWAITLTITSFPDLARILSDVKLLHTDLGRTALTSAIINDICSWFLLVLAIIISHKYSKLSEPPLEALVGLPLALLPIICFLLVCWFVLRPGIDWMITRIKNKAGRFSDNHVIFVLIGVAICGFITDACGTHSVIGGFLFGLIFPYGELAITIMERTEEFMTGIMLPAFIVITGLRTNFIDLLSITKLHFALLVAFVATSAKIISTVVVCLSFGMSLRDGISLGSLMNTKGVMALIVLNEGRSLKAIDNVLMAVMLFAVLVMTGLVGPIFFLANKTAKRTSKYKQRTIQRRNTDTELRILACTHSVGNLSGMIKLLEVSHATRKSPICVFAVHLVELTSRASAMLIVHDTYKTNNSSDGSRENVESDHIIASFRNYESRNEEVTVQPLTAVSSFTSIHEDIIEIAEDKVVAVILIPFHKQPTADGELQGDNHSIRQMNRNLLAKATCSVGILVDRGIGSATILQSPGVKGLKFAMIFIGGPDDREALTYAWRMAGKPGVTLTVVRFLPNKVAEQHDIVREEEQNSDDGISPITKGETENELDDEFINEFRFKSMYDASINYNEKMVKDSEEIVESMIKLYHDFDLYIVGRGEYVKSPLTMGLSEWSNDPDLGALGDTLVSSNFAAHASVLVVQQAATRGFRIGSHRHKRKFGQRKWASPILNPDIEVFAKKKDC